MIDRETSPLLNGISHGFFGREGGVSTGQLHGLQCGFGADDAAMDVCENRRIACDAILPGGILLTPHQVHSADVLTVDGNDVATWEDGGRPVGDALATGTGGLILGIVTADCAPVLLADPVARVIGAAHAGWRGAHGGIIENTISAMIAIGARAENIAAVVGPAIQQASYEVDDGFRDQFNPEDSRFFAPGRDGHWQFDLTAYVLKRINSMGIARAGRLKLDTYTLENRYFSYRRATHRGENTYGRQISLIALA